jgi:hypothetical protein
MHAIICLFAGSTRKEYAAVKGLNSQQRTQGPLL